MSQQDKTREPNKQPVEPVDLALAQLTALIHSLEEKRDKQTEEAKIPDDIPRFLTY